MLRNEIKVAKLALPNDEGKPTYLAKFPLIREVSLAIAVQLRAPELDTGLRRSREGAARMAVPKAAVDEYDPATAGENEIRTARKTFAVEAVSVTETVDEAANDHLGSCSAIAYTGHDFGAAFGGNCVHGVGSGPQ